MAFKTRRKRRRVSRKSRKVSRSKRRTRTVRIVVDSTRNGGGSLLVVFGILLATGELTRLTTGLARFGGIQI